MQIIWKDCAFPELSVQELYAVLRLRAEVFVLEQKCLYQDLDDFDSRARHLLGLSNGSLLAYARLFAPGARYDAASIGRVVTSPSCRRRGVGQQLMRQAISTVTRHWGSVPIRIGAQSYLRSFYEDFGFACDGEEYLEDDIPHLPMLREVPR